MIRVVKLENGTIGKVIVGEYDEQKGIELFLPVNYGGYYENELAELQDIEYTEGTIEDYINYIEEDFGFGRAIKTHMIGEYQIIEYTCPDGTMFAPYINYEKMGYSYDSLDEAITGIICYKYDGANSQANKFLWKMIK